MERTRATGGAGGTPVSRRRVCNGNWGCGRALPLAEFTVIRRNADGLPVAYSSMCAGCRTENARRLTTLENHIKGKVNDANRRTCKRGTLDPRAMIQLAEAVALWREQDGRCKLCHRGMHFEGRACTRGTDTLEFEPSYWTEAHLRLEPPAPDSGDAARLDVWDDQATLDRIDTAPIIDPATGREFPRGYRGNAQWLCWGCNRHKSTQDYMCQLRARLLHALRPRKRGRSASF